MKTRDLFIDEKLNLIVMKDTPDAMRLAEQLIAAQDLAEPEVMLEVEVLEIALEPAAADRRALSGADRLGVSSSRHRAGHDRRCDAIIATAGDRAAAVAEHLVHFASPTRCSSLNLRQQDGSANVLANPRIRVKNREKAKIHIGDRVPVITTTVDRQRRLRLESVSYLDVGLKLDVEPLIYLDDEVGIKVGLEV